MNIWKIKVTTNIILHYPAQIHFQPRRFITETASSGFLDNQLFTGFSQWGWQQELGAPENRRDRVHSLLLCFHAELLAVAGPLLIYCFAGHPSSMSPALTGLQAHYFFPLLLVTGDSASLVGPLNLVHTSESSPFDKFFSLEPCKWDFVSCCGPGLTHLSNSYFQQKPIPLNLGKIGDPWGRIYINSANTSCCPDVREIK